MPESIRTPFPGVEAVVESIAAKTMLGRAATLDDVGNAAVFAASDWARTLTAAKLNITCGAEVDLPGECLARQALTRYGPHAFFGAKRNS